MRIVSRIRPAVLIVTLFGFVPAVHAVPITYVQTGTASGMLGPTPFTDALVTVTLTGDTDNVVPELFGPFNCLFCFVNVGTTTVEIAALGTATITEATGIWAFAQPVDLDDDPTTPEVPGVVIGTVDDPPATDSFTGLGGTGTMALLGYGLTTSIGPVSGIISGVGYPTSLFLNTTLGPLSFASNITSDPNGTFTATTGTAAVIPEPATLLLFGSGLAAFAARARRRARR